MEILEHYVEIMTQLERMLVDNNITAIAVEDIMNQREEAIKQINTLDSGFESIYSKVEEEIKENPTAYKEDIKTMQQYIPRITDLGVTISAMENRCKSKLDNLFATKRNEVKNFKISSKTAASYYKNAYAGYQTGDVRLMDQKK